MAEVTCQSWRRAYGSAARGRIRQVTVQFVARWMMVDGDRHPHRMHGTSMGAYEGLDPHAKRIEHRIVTFLSQQRRTADSAEHERGSRFSTLRIKN
jgi:hypothetical protein